MRFLVSASSAVPPGLRPTVIAAVQQFIQQRRGITVRHAFGTPPTGLSIEADEQAVAAMRAFFGDLISVGADRGLQPLRGNERPS